MKASMWNRVIMLLDGKEVTDTHLGIDKQPCLETADGLSISIGGRNEDRLFAHIKRRKVDSLGYDGELSWLVRLLNAEKLESIGLTFESETEQMVFIGTAQDSLVTLWFRRDRDGDQTISVLYDSEGTNRDEAATNERK